MLRKLLVLSAAGSLLAACSGDDTTSTPADTGADVVYADGPWTGRPDDGVDTAAPDAGEDATDATTDTIDEDATDAGSDATDAASDAATDASSDATDAASDGATDAVSDGPAPTPSAARIHEVYLDRDLEGDKVEFIEISGPAGVALDALRLRVINPDGSVKLDLAVADAGATMPANGLWVVGTSFTSNVDKIYGIGAWGLPSDSGAIQLTRNDGILQELLDVVGYGALATAPAAEPKAVVEGTVAAVPASGSTGKTIGRKSVPGDTNANATDFCVMNATPGAANGGCL